MARDEAYRKAEKKIEEARRTGATELDLSQDYGAEDSKKLTELPESLGQLTQLQRLELYNNQLTALPESLGQLTQLQTLHLSRNQLTALPESLGQLTELQDLDFNDNNISSLPETIGLLPELRRLAFIRNGVSEIPQFLSTLSRLAILACGGNELQDLPRFVGEFTHLTQLFAWGIGLDVVPAWISELGSLRLLNIQENRLTDLPGSLAKLHHLTELNLDDNPLNPELAAAHRQGLDAVKEYLRAKAEGVVVLNEAKLILIGEGEVGKSCLLDVLRDEPWQKHVRTHGIDIKPVLVTHRDDDGAETNITLNTWDFGGQTVYRPTHQLFFSAPAVYLVVWKPREGTQQGAVEYWINAIKHRAGTDAKVLIVGTYGGPQQTQPDIDLQDLREKFGADMILGSFHVDNRPPNHDEATDTWSGERKGIAELKHKIANVAEALPNVGREVATSWSKVLKNVRRRSKKDPYISYKQFQALCKRQKVSKALAKAYAGMLNELGYVIHYGAHDDLKEIVILKPDWLAKAISFVLDDGETRARHGLVSHDHLSRLWSHPPYEDEEGYPQELHSLFRRLMERFDLSYQVVLDSASNKPTATSLIAQLVDDQPLPLPDWGESAQEGDEEKRQVCQIVEKDKNQSANAEGLFYRLIARLHKYSLGRDDYADSVHWQRGLMLDDRYNGRAVLKHVGNDVHITVRAAYPDFLLYELTKEVQWLVENPDEGWAGLRCDVMVPCIEPCGLEQPGRGMFEVGKLKESKRDGRDEYPCDAPGCSQWQNIGCLLQSATVTRQSKLSDDDVQRIRESVGTDVGKRIAAKDKKDQLRFDALYSQADEQLAVLMQMLVDEAKNGPRLFSLTPVDTGFLDNPSWVTQQFRLTLWCEHSRTPLPVLCKDASRGSYRLERPREWVAKYGPALRTVTKTLSAILPVVAATTKLAIADDTYKGIEKGLDFGKALFGAALKGGQAISAVSGDPIISDSEHGEAAQAQNAMLRELHALLKERDPGFGGLVRVQNKRREFLWVHEQYVSEY